MSEMNLEQRDGDMRERLARLEAQVNSLASRDWVRDLVSPIKDAALSTQLAVTHLSERFEALFAAHDKLLQERARWEEEEHQAKLKAYKDATLMNIIKEKWAPIIAFLIAFGAIMASANSAMTWWIQHIVLPTVTK